MEEIIQDIDSLHVTSYIKEEEKKMRRLRATKWEIQSNIHWIEYEKKET